MAFEHVEPPVATVTLDAYKFPVEIAKQMLVNGWNYYERGSGFHGIDQLISALTLYREAAYGVDPNWPDQSVAYESIRGFIYKHPQPFKVDTLSGYRQYPDIERATALAIQLLDHIHFFKGLDEECVGISDDKPSIGS